MIDHVINRKKSIDRWVHWPDSDNGIQSLVAGGFHAAWHIAGV